MLRCRGLAVWGCTESFFSTDGLKKKAFTNGLFSAQDSGFTSCLFDGSRLCLCSHWEFGLWGHIHPCSTESICFYLPSFSTNRKTQKSTCRLHVYIHSSALPFPKEKTEKSPWKMTSFAVTHTHTSGRELFSILISWNDYSISSQVLILSLDTYRISLQLLLKVKAHAECLITLQHPILLKPGFQMHAGLNNLTHKQCCYDAFKPDSVDKMLPTTIKLMHLYKILASL